MIEAVGGQDVKVLSEETCIPVDLVRSILLRLRDRGLIDVDNQIPSRQRRRRTDEQLDDVYTSAFVFREMVGGGVLPFVHVLDASNPIKTKDTHPQARQLHVGPDARNLGTPSTRAVVNAIRQMQRRADEHGLLTRVPTIEQVRVEREPEEYLLDCRIAIQTRDADWRIADPFGIGFSRHLEGVFKARLETDENLQGWMTNWLESLANPIENNPVRPTAVSAFDTPSTRQRYPKLVEALRPAGASEHRSVTNIYAALEWAFFYSCEAHNPLIPMRQLRAETGPRFSKRISEAAASIGFEVPPHGFRQIPEGRFDDYVNRKAEMDTVIAIALLQAESDEEHPMRRLAESRPDLLLNLRQLASDRDRRAHGADVGLKSDTELASDAMMREVVSTLLPSVQFDSATSVKMADSEADFLLDARVSLLDTFGYKLFNKLGPDTQNCLLEAEKLLLVAEDGDNGREFLIYLYAALQGALRGFVSGARPLAVAESDYRSVASRRSHSAGFGDLPDGIRTVNTRRVREALEGRERSLGASVLVLLLTSSKQFLEALAHRQPTFLTDVDTIQRRRGHGNEPIPMSTADARILRRTAIITLETLLELAEED